MSQIVIHGCKVVEDIQSVHEIFLVFSSTHLILTCNLRRRRKVPSYIPGKLSSLVALDGGEQVLVGDGHLEEQVASVLLQKVLELHSQQCHCAQSSLGSEMEIDYGQFTREESSLLVSKYP